MPASLFKRFFRRFGIEIKRTAFGLDPWLDLKTLLEGAREPVILDIGANVGQTTRELAAILPRARIWAFEPNPEIFPQLVRNVGNLPRVTPVNAALGAAETTANLKITRVSVNASLLDYERTQGTDGVLREAVVQVKTVDDLAEKEGLRHIHLLKTDTQGYDSQVLKGAERMFRERRIQAVFVEVMFTRFYRQQTEFDEIYALLHGSGLYLSGFYNVAREHGRHIDWADALFIHPEFTEVQAPA